MASDYNFSFNKDLNICTLSHKESTLNIYAIFSYLSSVFSIYVMFTAYSRLIRRGLPDSYQIRKSAIMNACCYCVIIMIYLILTELFHTGQWYGLYAILVSGFGTIDFCIWIITNYNRFNEGHRPRAISAFVPAKKVTLQPKAPKTIFIKWRRDKHASKSCCKRCCGGIGISVVKDKYKTINESLRREVLAYTTEGIVQSISMASMQKVYTNPDHRLMQHSKSKNEYADVVTRVNVKINSNSLYMNDNMPSSLAKEAMRCCFKHIPYRSLGGEGKPREFCDYAPLVFKYIRNNIMGINDEEYKKSIVSSDVKKQLMVLKSCKLGEGASGAFFFSTHDSKYVIKTLSKSEVNFLLYILKDFVVFLEQNPHTILSRYVGLHSLKMYGFTKYFVVMENVFEGKLAPTEVYDLKGSWVGRCTDNNIYSGGVKKDQDLKRHIIMTRDDRACILKQIKKDTMFLQQHGIMDYSLLLGIYYMKIECDDVDMNVGSDVISEDEEEKNEAAHKYLGGIRAQIIDGPGLYYIGIIDTLQEYTLRKKLETFYKTYIRRDDGNGISCVDPITYQQRFYEYMSHIMISPTSYKQELKIMDKEFVKESVSIYPSTKFVQQNLTEMNRRQTNVKVMSNYQNRMKRLTRVQHEEVAEIKSCGECYKVRRGKVDQRDGIFYCEECWSTYVE